MGNHIPGVRIDGMNVLAVKEGMRFVKEYVGAGNGPMYVEMMTYRYHGHSMSDPGTTYRNREEIALTRSTRDPLEFVKRTLLGSDSEIYSFLDKPTVEKLVKEHLNGTENRRLLIWSLLNVEQWLNDPAISPDS